MRTLNLLFLMLILASFLMGQTDSTSIDSSITELDQIAIEALETIFAEDSEVTTLDSLITTDSPVTADPLVIADTLETSVDELLVMDVEQLEEKVEAMISDTPTSKATLIRNRQFRSMDALFSNPANLARDFDSFTSWNIIPDFSMNIHNSLLTPGWYKEWWTTGGVWDQAMKEDYLSTITDQDLAINVIPESQTLFGTRIGRFGLNLSAGSHIKMVLPGNLFGLPMQDITFADPIDNGGIELEVMPLTFKTSLAYAHPLSTPYGDLKLGANLNLLTAAGYMSRVSDDFTIQMTADSIHIAATGDVWATVGGQGQLDDIDGDNLESSDIMSELAVGVDLGLIMDLSEQLNQTVEVQLSLRNLGAQYKWTNLTHERWTYRQSMPGPGSEMDSIEQYILEDTSTVIGTNEELTVDVPTVLNLLAVYQPFSSLIIAAGIEKAFTDEVQFGYSPDLELSLQLNYYPVKWLDISYYMQPQFGDPAHIIGSGLHFGFLDMGLKMSFLNGFNSNAKGLGFGFHSSLHF